jgi:hypothetical protein
MKEKLHRSRCEAKFEDFALDCSATRKRDVAAWALMPSSYWDRACCYECHCELVSCREYVDL